MGRLLAAALLAGVALVLASSSIEAGSLPLPSSRAPSTCSLGDAPEAAEEPALPSATALAATPARAAEIVTPAASSVVAAAPTISADAVEGPKVEPSPTDPSEETPRDPLVVTWPTRPVQKDFAKSPFYFTAAFDGSLRFSLWSSLLEFSRAMKKKHGASAHLTFFVNAAFYTLNPGKSDIGHAMSKNEILVRRALTQQAINEGHDIGDHTMGHHDGRLWSKEEWLVEIDRFHRTMDYALFEPIADEEGHFVFPRLEPLAGAEPGATGAACEKDADCAEGRCVPLTPETRVCTQACNLKRRCPAGTACGAPSFRQDTDICVPVPAFPVELDGKTLFNARGEPNLKHPRLKPYRIVGFRAPYLAANDALYEALAERGYRYDTSQSAIFGPPYYVLPGAGDRRVLELALMLHPGALAIPMDYNYAHLKATGARMEADYEAGVLASYAAGHTPWNVGHHFAMFEEGAYLAALEKTVDLVMSGCPDEGGKLRCEGGRVLSFRELAQLLP